MNTFRDRFTKFLSEKKLSQTKFAKITGYEQRSVSRFLTGTTQYPRADFIIALAVHYPELNLRWLLLGEGQMWVDPNLPIDKTSIQVLLKNQNQLLQLLKSQ